MRYCEETTALLAQYLWHRRSLTMASGALFLSESHRNHAQPLSISMWSKVVQGVAARAGVPQFTTHTPRHLRLTDLARAGWDIHEIAAFAGHRSIASTQQYIHLCGRELATKLDRSMAGIHKWRLTMLQGGQE